MDRRRVLNLLGSAVPISLTGCLSQNTDDSEADSADQQLTTTTVSSTGRSGTSPVYIHKVEQSRETAINELLSHFETDFTDQRVAVKANFNSADPFPASTHPNTLATLFDQLDDAAEIWFAERSGMGDTKPVLRETGALEIAKQAGASVTILDALGNDHWRREQPESSHWTDGYLFPDVFSEADAVVQTCCLKTHRYGGQFTMSLKNSVGMVAETDPVTGHDYMDELHNGGDQRKKIAEINLSYDPAVVLMDGIKGFSNGGPARGELIEPGIMLASADRVALDAAGVAVLRQYDPPSVVADGPVFEQDQLARAVELGLGPKTPEEIELVATNDAASDIRTTISDELSE